MDPKLFPSSLFGSFAPMPSGGQTVASAQRGPQVPVAPPAATAQAPVGAPPGLPKPPPRRRLNLFDDEHRSSTLLAIGAGLLSGSSFGDGAGRAAQNLLTLRQRMEAEERPNREIGGPDNSFEIITDPRTGERTYQPVEPFQTYLKDKATKPKDVADMNGRAMFAVQKLPPEQRAAAYAGILANPGRYGVDPSTMPAQYDPEYAALTAGMGMTVSQALTRQQAGEAEEHREEHREFGRDDQRRRTDAYIDRQGALTSQGQQRIGQAQQRIGMSRAKAGATSAYEYRVGPDGRFQRRKK